MKRNNNPKYKITIIAAIASTAVVFLFYFVSISFPINNPNVFLEFQYTSDNYYKILINDSTIIDSDRIKRMRSRDEYYKTKILNLKLDKGNYKIQIKDSNERVLSKSLFKVSSKPKYIYIRKEIVIKENPYILI